MVIGIDVKTPLRTQVTVLKVFGGKERKVKATVKALSSYDIDVFVQTQNSVMPPLNQEIVATLKCIGKSQYYLDRGDVDDGPVNGSEKPWHLSWAMLDFSLEDDLPKTLKPQETVGSGNANADATKTLFGTPDATQMPTFIAANRRWVVEKMAMNDISAVKSVIELGIHKLADGAGEHNLIADVPELIKQAKPLMDFYNSRLMERLGVQSTHVVEEPESEAVSVDAPADPDRVKNMAEFNAYVTNRMKDTPIDWTQAACGKIVKDEGFDNKESYIAATGNSAEKLRKLLVEKLDNGSW